MKQIDEQLIQAITQMLLKGIHPNHTTEQVSVVINKLQKLEDNKINKLKKKNGG